MRSKLTFIFAGLLSSVFIIAQDLPQLIPPSPDQAAINKFGNIPVSYSSGLVNIDIPIYTIKTSNGLNVPIGLSYHASGVRVDEIASNVGLGWALNIGNSISATVRGVPDFAIPGLAYVGGTNPTLPSLSSFRPNGSTGDYGSEVRLSEDYELAKGSSENVADTQFDFFNLNFIGRSAKFVIDQARKVHTIPFEPIRVDILQDNLGEDYFVVYDEAGNRFTFDMVEKSKVSNDCSTKWDLSSQVFKNIPQAWYLSKIEPVSGDSINFHYTTTSYSNYYKLSESETIDLAISPSGECASDVYTTKCVAYMEEIQGQRLDSISFSNGKGKVIFQYLSRVDADNLRISSIQVKVNNELLKNYQLAHSYFGDNTTTTDDDRLRLDTVEETISDQKWSMEYNQSYTMPPRFSEAQDFWGFYNGNNSNSTHIPSYTSSTYGVTFSGADRTVDLQYAKTYSLKKMYYPTGGYSEFEYGSHQYYGEHFLTGQLGNHEVGGLRINKIVNLPGSNLPAVTRTFNYTVPGSPSLSSGRLIDKPKYDSRKKERDFINYTGDESFDYISYCDKVVLSSSSYNTLGRSSGVGVTYEYVTEILGLYGEGGRTEYKFTTFPDVENNPQSSYLPDHIFLHTGTGVIPPIEYTSNDLIEIHNETTSFAFRRGLLLHKKTYDSDSILLSKEKNSYNLNYDLKEDVFNHPSGENSFILNDIVIKRLYDEATVYYRTPIEQELASTVVPAVFLYVYSELTSAWVQLSETESTVYNSGDSVTTITTFGYGNKTHQQVTEQSMTDSKGDVWLTKNYFPDDVSGSGSLPGGVLTSDELSAANLMKSTNNHQLAHSLQTEQKKNGTLVSRTRNNFKNWSGLILPESLEMALGSNSLEKRVTYHSYDTKGNPLEVSKDDGIHISYIWGYDKQYPVVQGINITNTVLQNAINNTIATGWPSKPVGVSSLETLLLALGNMTTPTQKQIWKEFLEELNSNPSIGTSVQVTALTYLFGVGMTSQTDSNGISTYYEYDAAGRLKLIKDDDGNIVKTFAYHYKEY